MSDDFPEINRALIIEDNYADVRRLHAALKKMWPELKLEAVNVNVDVSTSQHYWIATPQAAQFEIDRTRPHLVFLDWDLVDGSEGLKILEYLKNRSDADPWFKNFPYIVHTSARAVDPARQAELAAAKTNVGFRWQWHVQKDGLYVSKWPMLINALEQARNQLASTRSFKFVVENGETKEVCLDDVLEITQASPGSQKIKLLLLPRDSDSAEPLILISKAKKHSMQGLAAPLRAFADHSRGFFAPINLSQRWLNLSNLTGCRRRKSDRSLEIFSQNDKGTPIVLAPVPDSQSQEQFVNYVETAIRHGFDIAIDWELEDSIRRDERNKPLF